MKTAEELFNEYMYEDDGGGGFIYKKPFIEAIREHDREIIEMIDGEIEALIEGKQKHIDDLNARDAWTCEYALNILRIIKEKLQ